MLLPMKITAKGQVTIPRRLREKYGLQPDCEVAFEATEHGVLIRRATSREEEIDRRLAKATGAASVPLSTEEIMRITRADTSCWMCSRTIPPGRTGLGHG